MILAQDLTTLSKPADVKGRVLWISTGLVTTWKTENTHKFTRNKEKPALHPSGTSGDWLSQKRGKIGMAPCQRQTVGNCNSSTKLSVYWQMPRWKRLPWNITLNSSGNKPSTNFRHLFSK